MQQKSYKKEQVVEIVQALSKRINDSSLKDQKIIQEIERLKEVIDDLQAELHSCHSGGIENYIPDATNELDAVVSMTEDATHTIIEACEIIQKDLQNKSAEETALIDAQLIKIIEACTFQDITGQRISKIIKALKNIDERACKLSKIIDETFPHLKSNHPNPQSVTENDSLLNGPSLPGEGISQEEIDKLLAEF